MGAKQEPRNHEPRTEERADDTGERADERGRIRGRTDEERGADVEPVDLSKACGACQNLEAYWADKARREDLRRRLEGAGSEAAAPRPVTGEDEDEASAASRRGEGRGE